jgi:hypothetical protein
VLGEYIPASVGSQSLRPFERMTFIRTLPPSFTFLGF